MAYGFRTCCVVTFLVILGLLLVGLYKWLKCCEQNYECFDCNSLNRIESIEVCCMDLNETDAAKKFFDLLDERDKLKVVRLRIAGCDHAIIKRYAESFPNLLLLDISYSNIESLESLDLQHKHLVKFNASHNKLKDIPENFFAKMPNINDVDFSHNLIEDIDKVREMPLKSVWIHLSNNKIRGLLSYIYDDLLNLEYLDLSNNSIDLSRIVDFEIGDSLETIRLENNRQLNADQIWPLVNSGVSVYVSWRDNDANLLGTYKGTKLRVIVTNRTEEGIFRNSSSGKIELHCREDEINAQVMQGKENSEIHVNIDSNQIENPTELLKCFRSSNAKKTYLQLHGRFTEELNVNVLSKWNNLFDLKLENTKFRTFNLDLGVLTNGTRFLSIIDTNLKYISNVSHLKNLQKLNLTRNQLENVPEILQHIYDSKPFELDISYNNLKNTNFKSTSNNIKKFNFKTLSAAHCKITNVTELIAQVGPSLEKLDISGNNLQTLNANAFHAFNLQVINMSYGNLSQIDFGIFKDQLELQEIDLSNNKLKWLNLTSALFSADHKSDKFSLHLEGNDLTEIFIGFSTA
ncbi:chaoptin-like, partial [Contarinia nasturtii]|uniref:chaoptin-like n=1 Tax=Contarinia nasturtii TaxID=265458 RepID=UPI0012D44F73